MSTKESFPIEEQEPLISVSEVIGLETPEKHIELSDDTDNDISSLSPYERWSVLKDEDSLYDTIKSLKPTIDSVVASFGGTGNPQITSKARVVAAKAIQSYDPTSGASLPTWVSNQLRQLSRDIRKSNSMVHVPDGIRLDGYAIYRAEKEFEDEHGREPTVDELADLSHLSVKRINDVRKQLKPTATENAFDTNDGSSLQLNATDYTNDALDYVYNDSDNKDKKILEYTVGYGGADVLPSSKIMEKLKLTPVQLSRRKARLSMRINDIVSDLEALQ